MAALGEVGNHTRQWLTWCGDLYNKCYLKSNRTSQNISFSHYIHGITTEDIVETPAIMFMKEFIDQSLPVCNVGESCITRRSVDIAFKDGRKEIVRVKIGGTLFFIGRGIVMDAFYNPLLVCTGIANPSEGQYRMLLKGIKLYCNPSVFSNQKDVMNKYIITHILPYVMKTRFYFYYLEHPDNEAHRYEVIISDDIYNFFEKPSIDVTEDITAQCNEILRNNIEMVKF